MSSNDNPEHGSPKPEHDAAVTTSPQETQPQPTEASESSPNTGNPGQNYTATETDSAAISSDHPQSDDTAPANHPANGGKNVAPVTSTTTTATPTDEPTTTVAQPINTESPSMETEEPKSGAELPSEQSDEVEGKELEDAGPSLHITLLLTTGSRHPFTIDGKYLRKRSVNVENLDPFAMSVYTLKELIWREWRSDWESRPSSPSSIRLISFGKLLDDKSPLSESKFNHDAPNVVHMTVKPQEIVDEEDAKGAKAQYGRENENNERSPGCRCVIL
ncbi:uncharacterized protein N7483_010235 [Penicillium malachiteum]|uniref:uncharacterized protein n=1 Tax=Penicillium malachiteum TaxID=1324776 RepID=UPI00254845AB|nr:uncharacterized protein N7483_010235 [Penicillium malachiteum]KAJ5713054.1 hypothetical protein N7483_010235 [Penicillium malachiteum]